MEPNTKYLLFTVIIIILSLFVAQRLAFLEINSKKLPSDLYTECTVLRYVLSSKCLSTPLERTEGTTTPTRSTGASGRSSAEALEAP